MPKPFDILLTCPPGLEPALADEVRAVGLSTPAIVPGGVQIVGHWTAIFRANLWLRGASRVLIRISAFRAMNVGQLEARAAKVDWAALIGPTRPVRVEAVCKGSRLHHGGLVAGRISDAIATGTGAPIADSAEGALRVFARVEDNLVTLSLDTSGELLHRRGHKQFTGKAPLRETLAALLLRQAGYRGDSPVLDPMCGSGTVPIEAAEIALGLAPGRARRFAFEDLRGFDADRWHQALADQPEAAQTDLRFDGFDRDAGAVAGAQGNVTRAGLQDVVRISEGALSALQPPAEDRPGLVFLNPPYGGRIGKPGALRPLYGSIGKVLTERFSGWRIAMITTDANLAQSTRLPFDAPSAPIPHGGLKIKLWQTGPLP